MKSVAFVVSFTACFVVFGSCPNSVGGQQRSDFVSDASHIIGTYQPAAADHSPATQAKAANELMALLDDKQKSELLHELDSQERREWTNLPAAPDAGGVRLGDLDEKQVKAVCDLMSTLYSKQGYQKMVNIMLADDQLLQGGRPRRGFGTENFSIVIFGRPSETEPWGFQLDGHHVGSNVAIEGEKLTHAPSFIGTQPQSFQLAGEVVRPLTGEIDDAYRLVNSLNDEQRKAAVVSKRRGDLRAGPGRDGTKLQGKGLECSKLNDEQTQILLGLIDQWVNDLPEALAVKRMEQLKGEVDQMHLEWNGETEVGSDISYRIVGPTLIIEYACQSLGGDPQQHLHTMYRDPTNDYGGQLDAEK